MDTKTRSKFEVRARIIKSMVHPARLFIVEELGRGGERCVAELTKLIGTDMSTVSRHLAILKNSGIIEDQKRGSQVYYKLRVHCVLDFVECVESVLECNVKDRMKLLRK